MTTTKNRGIWQRTEAYNWVAGSRIPVKLGILEEYAEQMTAPEVTDIVIKLAATVDVSVADDAKSYDFAKLIRSVVIKDSGGEWCNLSGNGIRLWNIAERGARQMDPATLPANTADAARTLFLHIPLELPKAARGRDTTKQTWEFYDGGTFHVHCGSLPTGFTALSSATIEVWFHVREGRRRESKSRLKLWEYDINAAEDTYDIGGLPRLLAAYTDLTTTNMTAWTATEVDSDALDFIPGMSIPILVEGYVSGMEFAPHAQDPFLDGRAIPLVYPRKDQKTGALAHHNKVRIKFNAAPPASAKLMVVAIVDRPDRFAARQLGAPDIRSAMTMLARGGGGLVSAKGKHMAIGKGQVPDVLQKALPQAVPTVG